MTPRERLETLSALACVSLIVGMLAHSDIGAIVALVLLLSSLFLPVPAAWFVAGWKAVTHRVAKTVTDLMLVLVHLLVVTPIGLLRRCLRSPSRGGTTFQVPDEPESGPDPESWDRPS